MMHKRQLAIALAVVTAILLVVLRWRSIAPPPPAELPSSRPEAARTPSAASIALAYHAGEDDDEPPDWQVAGVVVDEHGVPVPGASLEADVVCLHGPEHPPPATTDAEGRFALELLPDCTMWLYVSRDRESARIIVSKLPGAPVTIEVIPDNDVIVHVVDSVSRAPLGNVHAVALPCRRDPCPEIEGDGSGTLRLSHARSVRVTAAGYTAGNVYVENAWRPLDEGPVALEQTLALARIWRVIGQLVDADGAPVVGAEVSGWYSGTNGFLPTHAITDDGGRFEIDVPAGTYLYARKDCAHGALVADGTAVAGQPLVLRTKLAGPCEPAHRPWQAPPQVAAPPSPSSPPPPEPEFDMVATVVDEAGRPVPKAEVRSFSSRLRPGRTDAAGRYVFRAHDVWDLYARRGERMSTLVKVDRDHREVTLQIQPAAITGIVVDGEGQPVAKAWVRVRVPRGEPMFSETLDELTDAEGHFGFVLPPGRYLVSAFDQIPAYGHDASNATVISTNTRDVTFEIP